MATILKDRENARKEKLVNLKELGFEITKEGDVIGYKTFGSEYDVPSYWTIKKGAILEEDCWNDEHEDCGKGINFATLSWVEDKYGIITDYDNRDRIYIYGYKTIWKLVVKNDWLDGLVVPENSDGKVRCERAMLLEKLSVNCAARVAVREELGFPLKAGSRAINHY